jgi:hypothetical protein
MKNLVFGLIVGLTIGAAALVYAEVTAPHFDATDDASIQKCFDSAQAADSKTVVSFPLTPEGIDQSKAVCWPSGIN